MSDSLQPHGLQYARVPCSSLSPGVWSNLCPLSEWCYLTISSSAAPFAFNLSQDQSLFFLIRWPKYWSFSFRISPSHDDCSGLISFRIDWFYIFAVQGTLKSLPHHHNLKASIPGTRPSLWFSSHIHTWLLEKPWLWLDRPLLAK